MTASTTPETTTITDAGGAFRFEVTHSGSLSFTLSAKKACYETAPARSITLTDNTAYKAKAIELPPAPEPQGNDRFSLTPPGGPTYTLTIADCVRTIAAGEFTPTPVKVTDPSDSTAQIDAVTKLDGLLGSTNQNSKVRSIILPESLVSIGERAFVNHRRVTGALTIPASTESIGVSSFHNLGVDTAGSTLVTLRFAPNSRLKSIGDDAFKDSQITAMDPLPESLEIIGLRAFFGGNPGILSENFTIPVNVKSVDSLAFAPVFRSSTRFSGTLTAASPHLERTGPALPERRTGTLGFKLFEQLSGVSNNPFDRIFLHEAVFNSYSQEELNEIFGVSTGGKGRYFDINDKDRSNPREFTK